MSSASDGPQFDFQLERTIHVRRENSESSGPLTIGPIHWLPDRNAWACYWSIHVIEPKGHRFYGEDPIQALERTLEFIGNLIRGSIEDGFAMWWQHEGDSCGFPPKE